MEKYIAHIVFWKHESFGESTVSFLKNQGWQEITRKEKEDMIDGGFGSGAYQEPATIVSVELGLLNTIPNKETHKKPKVHRFTIYL